MNTDYSKVMSERTDRQLVEILTLKKHEYQPGAIIAAEQEFQKRNLSFTDFPIEVPSETTKSVIRIRKFEWYHKVLTVLLPAIITPIFVFIANHVEGFALIRGLPFILMILFQYLIYKKLKNSGEVLIATDFLKWVTYSYYIYIGLALFIALAIYFLS